MSKQSRCPGSDSHTISSEGISIDPSKVQEVMDWKPPTSIYQIRSFLELMGYYCRFIPDFSRMAKPMTELLKKDVKFKWDAKCDEVFHTLRAQPHARVRCSGMRDPSDMTVLHGVTGVDGMR